MHQADKCGELSMGSTRTSSELARSEQWTVSEMARRAKCTLRTIRFYEQRGLLSVEARTGGRHRRYSLHDLERLRLIVELRRAGLSLDEIRAMLEIKRRHASGAVASLELRARLEGWIAVLDARVAELSRIRIEFEQLQASLLVCKDCRSEPTFPDACAKCERHAAGTGEHPPLWALWNH
jgi:DNA-binding transcriptional MerR regulator